MNAMRPWARESELANYIESQRSITRAKTPVTPTYPPAQVQPPSEDLMRFENLSNALQDLRLRLANHDDLLAKLDLLQSYLEQLHMDLPLQSPDEAFERLQALRSLLFWLPPALFRPNESDTGAIALLSYFYAAALSLEPLFPEIGGSYLGTLVIAPLERLQSILFSRRAAQPQDPSTQVALSLLEIPMQVLASYRSRQRQLAHSMDAYRHSPRSPFSVPSGQMVSSPEMSQSSIYSHSPAQSPGSLQVPVTSYFQGVTSSGVHRHSSPQFSVHPMAERSSNRESPLIGPQISYTSAHMGPNYETQSGMSYRDYESYPSFGMHSRLVTPLQLWV